MRFFAAPSLRSGLRLRMTGSEGLAMTQDFLRLTDKGETDTGRSPSCYNGAGIAYQHYVHGTAMIQGAGNLEEFTQVM